MAIRDKQGMYWVTALFLAVVLVLGVLHGCKRDNVEPNQPASPNGVTATPAAKTTSPDPLQAAANLFREPKAACRTMIKAAAEVVPAFEDWRGKPAPDFTLTDIEGKPHKLSDYRGRNVVVVFWATWCGPCKLEVPHLKGLQESYSKDKLAILAISEEPVALVKTFVQEQGITYTVLTSPGDLAAPFGRCRRSRAASSSILRAGSNSGSSGSCRRKMPRQSSRHSRPKKFVGRGWTKQSQVAIVTRFTRL